MSYTSVPSSLHQKLEFCNVAMASSAYFEPCLESLHFKQVLHCLNFEFIKCIFHKDLLKKHRNRVVFAHVGEQVCGRSSSSRVDQINEGTILACKANALVPHLSISSVKQTIY